MSRSLRFLALPAERFAPLFAVRASDAAATRCGAEVVAGHDLGLTIERLFARPEVRYLHVHNAGPGCYSRQVVRA